MRMDIPETNYAIDYMIRVLSRQLDRHMKEYEAEGLDGAEAIIRGWDYEFTGASLEAWIGVLERHRHCSPAVPTDKGHVSDIADETR